MIRWERTPTKKQSLDRQSIYDSVCITLKTDKAMYGGRIQDSGYLWGKEQ